MFREWRWDGEGYGKNTVTLSAHHTCASWIHSVLRINFLAIEVRLDGALGSLVWYEMWRLMALPAAGEVEFDDP